MRTTRATGTARTTLSARTTWTRALAGAAVGPALRAILTHLRAATGGTTRAWLATLELIGTAGAALTLTARAGTALLEVAGAAAALHALALAGAEARTTLEVTSAAGTAGTHLAAELLTTAALEAAGAGAEATPLTGAELAGAFPRTALESLALAWAAEVAGRTAHRALTKTAAALHHLVGAAAWATLKSTRAARAHLAAELSATALEATGATTTGTAGTGAEAAALRATWTEASPLAATGTAGATRATAAMLAHLVLAVLVFLAGLVAFFALARFPLTTGAGLVTRTVLATLGTGAFAFGLRLDVGVADRFGGLLRQRAAGEEEDCGDGEREPAIHDRLLVNAQVCTPGGRL